MDIGSKYKTKDFGLVKIIKYNGCYDVDVMFLNTGFVLKTNTSNIKAGKLKDKLSPSVLGVGFVGVGEFKPHTNRIQSRSYSAWHGIMIRCYDPKFKIKNPTYKDCTVHPDWHNFQNFAKWYEENHPDDGGKYHIDKDILSLESKVYSQYTCVIIPQWLNKFARPGNINSQTGTVGVDFVKSKGLFRSVCMNPKTKKREYLGLFSCKDEAHEKWKIKKLEHAYSMKKDIDNIDVRIYPNLVRMIKGFK